MTGPDPYVLAGTAGSLFALHFAATGAGRAVLVLPPFAEELNKLRRMLSLAPRGDARARHAGAGVGLWKASPSGRRRRSPWSRHCIESQGERLIGVLHRPQMSGNLTRAVVVVVGGPQYRIGSHRQFVVLARSLARDVCPWGLCDAASAALMYVQHDPRVSHLVLVNPWVSTSAGQAQVCLDAYYDRKFRRSGFWRRMAVDPSAALKVADGFLLNLRLARQAPEEDVKINEDDEHFLVRMPAGANTFRGRVLLLLSGRDQVATGFELLLERSDEWRNALAPPRVVTRKLPAATHTFSRQVWRDWAAADFIA